MEEKLRSKIEQFTISSLDKKLKDILTRLEIKNDVLWIEYQRDGISNEAKKSLESSLLDHLKDDFDKNKIYLLSKSKQAEVKKQKEAPVKQDKAQLKVGHSQPAPKKRVPGVKNIVAIGSGKGGVGKSTFTVNLAASLVSEGKRVGVIDADVYGPSLPTMFNKKDEKPQSNGDKKILPVESHGIKFMSFGLFIGENEPVIWRGPMLGGVINQFLFDVDWGELDYLLIDLPPGTGDVQLSLIQATEVDAAMIISTPQDIALLDSIKAFEMFNKLNIAKIAMVENMSFFVCGNCGEEHHIFGHAGLEKRSTDLKVPFLGKIPLEQDVREGADRGMPLMSDEKNSEKRSWKAYKEVTIEFESLFSTDKKKPGFFKRLFS